MKSFLKKSQKNLRRFLMSVEAIAWAFSVQNLTSSMKLVLIALADNADQDFKCWPAVETISKKTCLSERAVHSNLVKLVDCGLLKKEQRFNKNGQTSNMYYLQRGVNEMHTPPAPNAVTPLHEVHTPPARGADEPSINHQLEPSNKYTDSFEEFWTNYPNQRKGSKQKTFKAYLKAIERDSPMNILAGCMSYAISDEVERGFAKGAEAWLNDDRWLNNYNMKGYTNGKQSNNDKVKRDLADWVQNG